MNLVMFKRPRAARQAVPSSTLLYPRYPIEQTFRSSDPGVQQQFVEYPHQRFNGADQVLFADYDGLRVLAQSEAALNVVANTLRDRFGGRIDVGPPVVRYAFGVPTLEPYMAVLVMGPLRHLSLVKDDILQRRASVEQLSVRKSFVLRAEAPLAALLGYEKWLQTQFGDQMDYSYAGVWLNRYVPIDGSTPDAA